MPVNIEVKAKARDPERQRAIAASLATEPGESIDQTDTYFVVPRGRLKLRELRPDFGELIFYERADLLTPKPSTYSISPTSNPANLRAVLARALGVRVEVRKRRTVYIVGQTRVHLDEVGGLGCFWELEVVLRPGQDAKSGIGIAADLMRRLEIEQADLVEMGYAELNLATHLNRYAPGRVVAEVSAESSDSSGGAG